MFNYGVLKVLLAAACFTVAASFPSNSQSNEDSRHHTSDKRLFPFNNNPSWLPNVQFTDQPSVPAQESSEDPTVHEQIVYGQDVDGASELANSQTSFGYSSKQQQISSNFAYPFFKTAIGKHKITKIIVLIQDIDEDATSEVNIKDGGVEEKSVRLQILAKNSQKLTYKVLVYGVPAEN